MAMDDSITVMYKTSRTHINGAEAEMAEYETIDITILRRGVIGVNKIGYILNAG